MTWLSQCFRLWSREDVQVNQRLVSACYAILEGSYNHFAAFAIRLNPAISNSQGKRKIQLNPLYFELSGETKKRGTWEGSEHRNTAKKN